MIKISKKILSGRIILNFLTLYDCMPKPPLKIKILLLLIALFLGWFWLGAPSTLFDKPTSYVIEDRNGVLLNASIAEDGQWRFPKSEMIPEKFIQSILTFEDKRFFFHSGVDIIAFGRAIVKNLKNKKTVQGGSTITMQVVRLSRPHKPRNLWQKLLETFLAIRLEASYSKNEILQMYASNAPFGGNVIGLETAAWRYYGREAAMLSWGEMTALAVLPNAPSLVHPGKNRLTLERKRNRLLDELLKNKLIDSATCALSKLEPLPGNPLPLPQLAPHLLQRFKNDVATNDLDLTRIKTTVDKTIQKSVIEILNNHHDILKANSINNACALILEVNTGNVLAYAGNIYRPENPNMESDVDVIKAPRSPGSTLKPILFASALTEGMVLPNSLLADVPTQIGGYTPQNYDRQFDGAVPASLALARSLNIPSVKLLQQYKYARFYDLLKQLGMTTLNKPADNYGLSLILGGSEVTMWDLAGIYAGMARTVNHQIENKGVALKKDFYPPNYCSSEIKKEQPESKERLNSLDAPSVWFTFQAMEELMRPGEEGLWQQFTSSQRIAWKTGTSFGFRDAWAIGITPKFVVAVWVGNTNGEGRAGLIGVQTAAPIMFDIFKTLPAVKWFQSPQNHFSFIPVCRQSGFRANYDCLEADTVMVSKNGFKAPLCPYHQLIHLDKTETYRVNENCESPGNMVHKSWFVLPPTMEWYYKLKNHDYKILPSFVPGCQVINNTRQIEIVYPQQNAKIYVPLEIDGQRGKTIFTATHRKPGTKLFWHLDREFLGETINNHQMAFSPPDGKHVLTIIDEAGESVTRNFEILAIKR
ncbi:MAG: penicillin-binding protein 1C [Ginsengibacter sp.]